MPRKIDVRHVSKADLAEAKQMAVRERAEARQKRRDEEKAESAQALARREMARRELARRHLLPFVTRFEPKYLPGWVHKDICARLEKFSADVDAGLSPRLMIQMPPRHGKSVLASVNFPAWHLGRHPDHEIIACSYASTLATSFSRKVRSRVVDPSYQQLFKDAKLDADNRSAEAWMTTVGGGYVAAGVGGGITGKGAHVLIIDDPVKNAEDAESDVARQSAKDWYRSTAFTRLAPGGGVLIIQTRWHDDDLSGWLLNLMKEADPDDELAERWELVQYPAMALEDEAHRAKGDALHPARYDQRALMRIRKAVGERVWWALYQQQPVAEEGEYFTKGMFRYYQGAPPSALRLYAAWDLAISKKEKADFTVGVVIGVDAQENIFILDLIRGRWDAYEITEQILNTYERYKTEICGIEKSQIEMAIGPHLDKRIAERKLHSFYYKILPPGRRDKELRARPIQARLQQGKVFMPMNADWVPVLQHEMLRFPNGVHDDMVDALAWVGQMLNELTGAAAPRQAVKQSWRDKLSRLTGSGPRDPMAA